MNKTTIIRPLRKSEYAFLDIMLYNAIFIPPGKEKLPADIIRHPDISRYIRGFGRKGDKCFVAELDGEPVGAIWSRLFNEQDKGYGYIDSGTPELCMAVLEPHRKKGTGTLLLQTMIRALAADGYKQVSLSVDRINYAYDLYKKTGFKDFKMVDESVTMVMKIG